MKSIDRALVEELLGDESLSYREVARRVGCSDWAVRKAARQLDGDPRPMKQRCSPSDEPSGNEVSPLVSWLVFGAALSFFASATWVSVRWMPPLESTDFPHGFYCNPPPERMDDETDYSE